MRMQFQRVTDCLCTHGAEQSAFSKFGANHRQPFPYHTAALYSLYTNQHPIEEESHNVGNNGGPGR
jgi:hypothetical protein